MQIVTSIFREIYLNKIFFHFFFKRTAPFVYIVYICMQLMYSFQITGFERSL